MCGIGRGLRLLCRILVVSISSKPGSSFSLLYSRFVYMLFERKCSRVPSLRAFHLNLFITYNTLHSFIFTTCIFLLPTDVNLPTTHTGTSNSPKSKTMNPPVSERPLPKKQGSWWVIGRSDSGDKEKEKENIKEKDNKSKDKEDALVVAKSQTQIAITDKDAGTYIYMLAHLSFAS